MKLACVTLYCDPLTTHPRIIITKLPQERTVHLFIIYRSTDYKYHTWYSLHPRVSFRCLINFMCFCSSLAKEGKAVLVLSNDLTKYLVRLTLFLLASLFRNLNISPLRGVQLLAQFGGPVQLNIDSFVLMLLR